MKTFKDFFNRPKTIKTSLSKIAGMVASQHAKLHVRDSTNRGVDANYETTITHHKREVKNKNKTSEYYVVTVTKNGERFVAPETHLTSGKFSPKNFYRRVLKLHGITDRKRTNKVKRPENLTPNDKLPITIKPK